MDFTKEIQEMHYFYVKALAMKIAANPAVVALADQGLGCGIQVNNGHRTAGEYFIVSKGEFLLRDDDFPEMNSRDNAADLNEFLEDYVQLHGSLDGLRCFIAGAFDIR